MKAYYDALNVYNDKCMGWLWHKMVSNIICADTGDASQRVLLITCDRDLPSVCSQLVRQGRGWCHKASLEDKRATLCPIVRSMGPKWWPEHLD